MIGRDFEPGFMLDHFLKDMSLALDEATRAEMAVPCLALVHQLYEAVPSARQGYGRSDTQTLIVALASLSKTKSD